MMLLASLPTKFLTHVGQFGDHSRNRRRFAPTLPHFTGIGAPLQRNPHQQLDRLQGELKEDVYQPQPVRQVQIPKAGKPGEFRTLGIPTIYDRVCQQALLNRLEPIFEPVFDDANFGYRRGRSTKDALRKVWKEIKRGREWIVDADLKDFFGSVEHEKLLTLVAQRVADGRVLRLIRAMLKAGGYGKGGSFPASAGLPRAEWFHLCSVTYF